MPSKIAAASQKRKQGFLNDLALSGTNNERLEKLKKLQNNIGKIILLSIKDIIIENNVRKTLDTESESFIELVNSIRENNSVLQNLIVELEIKGDEYRLICIAGQRRLAAAHLVGIEKTPVLLKQYDNDAERCIDGLTENLTRRDLPSIDIAEAYTRLIKDGLTEEQIANRFDKGGRTVRKYITIGKYPQDVRDTIRKHPETFTTRVLFNKFASRTFDSTEALRNAIQAMLSDNSPKESRQKPDNVAKDAFAKSIEQRIKTRLEGVKIKINGDPQKGVLKLTYTSAQELQRLLTQIEK